MTTIYAQEVIAKISQQDELTSLISNFSTTWLNNFIFYTLEPT